MLEEFHPKVLHVAGKENDVADALSRLGMADNPNEELEWETTLPPLTNQDKVRDRIQLLLSLAAEKELKPTIKSPLAPDLINCYQQRDKTANTTSPVLLLSLLNVKTLSITLEKLISHLHLDKEESWTGGTIQCLFIFERPEWREASGQSIPGKV